MVEYLTENQGKAGSIPPIGINCHRHSLKGKAVVFKIIDAGSSPAVCIFFINPVTELVDVVDLKSAALCVWVQLPPWGIFL
jgi:hypothetical protein